ncbi:ABC transporter substrate-binding protein [Desulfosporosinus sp. FKA]|uniref:ABC transporter substrate-binding protein n=1 Tax=Desulfosporosinus sp. FKA TaxID=1969834 RepID=UPI000B4A106F|nr:ABC transporter substrate-binding protein [Desulfosporosinus sp. FKA]
MKSKRFKFIAWAICAVILTFSIAGCSTTSATQPASQSPSAAASDKREITDMLGNKVKIPAKVNKVFCTSPIGTYIVYTLAPNKLLGWNSKMSEDELKYISPKYKNLQVLGGNMGGQNTFNTEAITALSPDIILDFAYNGQTSDMVTELGKQTGIPVVIMDSALKSTAASYRLLGKILGVEDRGNMLADYVQKSLDRTAAMVAKVPADEKVKIYYAESADGLKTDGNDSMHTEVINFVNATNVVTMDTSSTGKGASVSMEQVLKWNPDVILANSRMGGSDFLKTIYSDKTWADVKAVQNKRIYVPASLPFGWFDRPPCIARVIGVEWLAAKLYPDYVKVDLKSDVKNFYKTFYGVEITDAQADSLING